MGSKVIVLLGAALSFTTPSLAHQKAFSFSPSSFTAAAVNGGNSGDRSGRFPRPDVGGAVDRIERKTNRDKRLENPGSGHWPE